MNRTDRKAKALQLLALTAILAGLNGCSSAPNAEEIKRALGSGIPNCPHEYFEISNLKKTNGVAEGNLYTVSYAYDLTVVKDFPDLESDKMVAYQWDACLMSMIRSGVIPASPDGLSYFSKKGQNTPLTGEMTMIKSEKGWIRAR